MKKIESKLSLMSKTSASDLRKKPSKAQLSKVMSSDNKRDFVKKNILALTEYGKQFKSSKNLISKGIVKTTEGVTPKKTKIKINKKLLTSYNISSYNSKLSFSRYKSDVIGVDEGLISLPRVLTPKRIEPPPKTEKKEIVNINQHSKSPSPPQSPMSSHREYISEIRRLNHWDYKHAKKSRNNSYKTSQSMQFILNSVDQSSMKWLLEIKSDPKQLAILSRNKYLNDFFNKIDKEQKAIFLQSMNINKKDFDFGIFDAKSEAPPKETKVSQIDCYREIMKTKVKIEDMLKTDLCQVAQELYQAKEEKKIITEEIISTTKEINSYDDKINKIKVNDFLDKAKMSEEMRKTNETKPSFISKLSSHKVKELRYKKKSMFIEASIIKSKETQDRIHRMESNKKELQLHCEVLQSDCNDLTAKIHRLKMKLNQRISTLSKYYFDILKKGIDVRRNGIVWAAMKLLWLKQEITPNDFPVFLSSEQIGYIQTLAIKSYEVSELINLFTTLNKRQKKLKESYTSSNINNIKHTAKRIKRTKTQIKIENANSNGITAKSMRKMEMISNKYENVINMCLNENKEEEYLNEICKDIHDRIINNDDDNDKEFFFLPGSLSEFFDTNKKYRECFEDIVYLKEVIVKKEKEIALMKENMFKQFRKESEYNSKFHKGNKKSSIQNEMIFAALFGNGITI